MVQCYVKSKRGSEGYLHARTNCFHLQRAKGHREVDDSMFPHSEFCPNCGDEIS